MAVVLLALSACGATDPHRRWDAAVRSYYTDTSVRPANPARSEWQQRDEELLLRRLGYADVVVLATAKMVNLYTHRGQPRQLSVTLTPVRVIYGSVRGLTDPQGDLSLSLHPVDEDFQTALRLVAHVPGSQYLLVLKHPSRDSGKTRRPRLFWATYNPDAELLAEVEAMFRWLERER